jgi:putative spermidine/putrescine transport system permease protein
MTSVPVSARITSWAWGALIALLYLFLLAPILVVLVMSFDTRAYLSFPPESFSLASYGKVLTNQKFVHAFFSSLGVGAAVGILAVIAGVLIAYALTRFRFPARNAVSFFVISPFLVPHIVLAVGLLLIFAQLGLLDTYVAVVLAHLGITIPYVVRTVSISLLAVDQRVEEAARVHGASPAIVFRRVTLPLIRPGLIAGAAIAFLVSFDESTISLFIVNTRVSLLPVEIFHYIEIRTDPQIAALSVVLILISVMLVVLVERLIGLRKALR